MTARKTPVKKAAAKKPAAKPATTNAEKAPDIPATTKAAINPVKPGEMQPQGYFNNSWETVVPGHINPDDLSDPRIWVFMRNKFKTGDMLRITADNFTWIAQAVVTNADAGDIHVRVYDVIELGERTVQEMEYRGYLIRNEGAVKRYTVTAISTGVTIRENIMTQRQAFDYVDDQIRASQVG